MSELEESKWYVAYCRSKQEQRAQLNLNNQGFTTFLPLIKLTKLRAGKKVTVTEPLFSRYLFVKLGAGTSVSKLRSTRGVINLVRTGMQPAVVANALIEQLIQQQSVLQQKISSEQQFKPGDTINILAGPFADLPAIFDMADGDKRSVVLLQFLGQQHSVSIDNTILQKQ